MTDGDGDVMVEVGRRVEVLQGFPRLISLIEETSGQPRSLGTIGLATREESGGVAWFLLAGDEATCADADAFARAFVWPSYARARRSVAHLTPGDPFADAVQRRSPGGVIVLFSPAERSQACARAIDLMFETRNRRPSGVVIAPRPIGRVLRDFDDAISRRDIAGARELLNEAWATGRLSLVNRSYLQVRVLAAQHAWDEVLDHAVRHRLPALELPRMVEDDLIRAIYWVYLHEILEADEIRGAIDLFRDRAQPIVGDVFRDHRGVPDAATRRAWMIRLAALDREWPLAVRVELLALTSDDERAQLDRIAEYARFSEPISPEQVAAALLTAHEDAAAFSLAEHAADLSQGSRAGILVQAALRLDDPTRLRVAAEAVDAVGAPDRVLAPAALVERVSTNRRPAIAVDGWSTWLRALFDQPDWPDAVRVVDEHGDEWAEAVARGEDSIDDVGDVVEALAGEEALRIVLPRLIRVMIPDGERRVELVRARRRLLQALAYAVSQDPASGVADLDALADILAALLEAGLSIEDFDRLADEIEEVWRRMSGPPRLARWVVDVLVVVTTYPCPSESRRAQMLGTLLAPLCSDAARGTPHVHREVWLEIKDLLEGSALSELVPEGILDRASAVDADDKDDFAHLEHRSILFHTLVPGAAERAAAFIKRIVPSSHIVTDESHVASGQLRDQVRRADFVVIAPRAAKHAATDFIRQEASVPIAWAAGKGWSSLVDALRAGAVPV